MRRISAAVLACVLAVVLAVITPDASAVADVLVSTANPVTAVPTSRDIPDNGELEAEDIERLGGEPEVPEHPAPEMPQGDFSTLADEQKIPDALPPADLSVSPNAFDGDRQAELADEVESLPVVDRDLFSVTYERSDGSLIKEESTEALNVETAQGWEEISTEVEVARGGGWRVDDHPLQPRFAQRADHYRNVSVTHYYNPNTEVNVIVQGDLFLTAFKLSPAQTYHLLTTGSIGGG